MAVDYVMPKLAMAMNEGTVADWVVADGEYVEKGAPLMVVETEKVAYDLESPESGWLHVIVPQGETVPVESIIAQFAASEDELSGLKNGAAGPATAATAPAEEAAAPAAIVAAPAAAADGSRIKASPLARKLAADAGLQLTGLAGSGPGGRIVKRDILAAIERGVSTPAAAAGDAIGPLQVKGRVPLKGMRGAIAKSTMQSLHNSVQVSMMTEIEATRLIAARKLLLEREEELGTRVSQLAFMIKALAVAARAVPIANSSIVGDEVVLWEDVHIGIAVALPGETDWDSGLVVPVLRHADRKGLVQIDRELKDLAKRARTGELQPEETRDATITLSSTAGLCATGAISTPVLNGPQAIIIQPGNVVDKPVVRDGQIVVRPMMAFSLTFDHRILDGKPFNDFYNKIHHCIENPELMLA